MKYISLIILSSLFGINTYAGLSEFGTIISSKPGHSTFTVDDGNPMKRYCVIEMDVEDKKIKWISHPLPESYVKRVPKFLYNFGEKQMLLGSVGKDKEDNPTAQIHLYTKDTQELELIADTKCARNPDIIISKKSVEFICGPNKKKIDVDVKAKVVKGFPEKKIEFKGKQYKAKNANWTFEIAETDNYFKDRLLVRQGNQTLKEYKANDFMRCFEHETLKGSQNKFSE